MYDHFFLKVAFDEMMSEFSSQEPTTIAAFNIRIFGTSKASEAETIDVLVKVCDVLCQGLKQTDCSGMIFARLHLWENEMLSL